MVDLFNVTETVNNVTEIIIEYSKNIPEELAPQALEIIGKAALNYATVEFLKKLGSICSKIPEENRIPPNRRIAKGVVENVINLEAHETTLQEMFANLLAGSMDNRKSEGVHPSYAKIISELSEDDAKFLKMLDQKKMVLFLIVYDINKNKSYYVYDSIPNYSNKGNLGIIFDTVIHQGLVSQNSIYPKKNYSIDILNDAVKWFNETEPSILNDLNIVDCKNVCINRYSMELTTRGKDFMQAVTLKESSTDEKS